MQVMTRVHGDKYDAFGGNHAAFDPISNLKVGVQVLRDCIARAGGLEAGLRWYVGAANLPDDGGYIAKVLTEQERLKRVANGKLEPAITPNTPVKPTPPERIVELTPPKADAADPQQVALLR
jgi:hypothetical protein